MIPLKDNLRYLAQPTMTTVIILLNCLFFIVEQALNQSGSHGAFLVQHYGTFTPANFTRAFGDADPLAMFAVTCSLFTAIFLHGGLMHIFGNMVFLSCFGRAVEVRLGKTRFVAFYLLAGAAGYCGQYLMNPLSEVPNLGASGAIAGVLSAYLMFWPRAKILGLSLTSGILYAPAWSFLIWWFGSQVVSVIFEAPHGGGGVAYMAHIGGFACGIMSGFLAKWLTPARGVTYDEEVTRSIKHARPLGVVRFFSRIWKSPAAVVRLKKVQPQEGV